MKTERVTLLATPQFKAFLSAEAKREGVSVAELVRARCERRPTEDESTLIALTVELRHAVDDARRALREGLEEARAVLGTLNGRPAARKGTSARNARRATGSAA